MTALIVIENFNQDAVVPWMLSRVELSYAPLPLSTTECGLPGSGLSVIVSVPLYDFFAIGLKVTA